MSKLELIEPTKIYLLNDKYRQKKSCKNHENKKWRFVKTCFACSHSYLHVELKFVIVDLCISRLYRTCIHVLPRYYGFRNSFSVTLTCMTWLQHDFIDVFRQQIFIYYRWDDLFMLAYRSHILVWQPPVSGVNSLLFFYLELLYLFGLLCYRYCWLFLI